jgi:hypothetical protein
MTNQFKIGDKVKVMMPVNEPCHPSILLCKTPICTVSKIDGDYVYLEETKRFGEIGNVGYHYKSFELTEQCDECKICGNDGMIQSDGGGMVPCPECGGGF